MGNENIVNLKIQNFMDNQRKLIDEAVNNGIPVYALVLATERISKNYLEPMLQSAMQLEYNLYQKQQSEAKPKSEPVTENLPNSEGV